MKNNIKYAIAASAAIVALGAIYFVYSTKKELNELTEQYAMEKESLEEEYSQLAIQYEGYKLNVNNDSLLDKLENERIKVQRLVEELKTTKASNARRISELKKELTTVRSVLRSYVAQVDSLNKVNEKLTEENRIVKRKYEEATKSANKLEKAKEVLTQQITRAAKLDAILIKAEALNKRNKNTSKINRAEKIHLKFVINKNVTAEVGEKDIFVRILKPDEDVMIKDPNNVFRFENKDINFSIRKTIEYDGEENLVDMYWNIEEYMFPGNYRFDIFADGNLIGQTTLNLEN